MNFNELLGLVKFLIPIGIILSILKFLALKCWVLKCYIKLDIIRFDDVCYRTNSLTKEFQVDNFKSSSTMFVRDINPELVLFLYGRYYEDFPDMMKRGEYMAEIILPEIGYEYNVQTIGLSGCYSMMTGFSKGAISEGVRDWK